MQMAYAWLPDRANRLEAALPRKQRRSRTLRSAAMPLESQSQPVPSRSRRALPAAGLVRARNDDLFGIRLQAIRSRDRLVLREGAHPSFPPLDPRISKGYDRSVRAGTVGAASRSQAAMYSCFPFGPVRGDVLESAQIVFYYIGEAILHCLPRLFFKHRGMEKRFEGLSPLLACSDRRAYLRGRQHRPFAGLLPGNRSSEPAARCRSALDTCAPSLRRWSVSTITFIILAISVIPPRSKWARRKASCWLRNASS